VIKLDAPLALRAYAPAQFADMNECWFTPHGFVTSGSGLDETATGNFGDSDYMEFTIGPDGVWTYIDYGADLGMAVYRNSDLEGIRSWPAPVPTHVLINACNDFKQDGALSYVLVMTNNHIWKQNKLYESRFGYSNDGLPTAYYYVIDLAFPTGTDAGTK